MRVKAKGKVVPTNFPKIVGRGTFVEVEGGQLVELVGDQNLSPRAPPRCKRERRCQERSDCQMNDGEGRIGVIEEGGPKR